MDHDIDLMALEALLEVLRKFGVTEFSRGDLHLKVTPSSVVGAPPEDKVPDPGRRALYEKAAGRRIPSFNDFMPTGDTA